MNEQENAAYVRGSVEMLDRVRAALREWPNQGCDVEVAKAVVAIRDKAVEEALDPARPRFTPRGFEDFGSFVDSHRQVVTVRESSSSSHGPCVHVFCHNELLVDYRVQSSPHLTVPEAHQLIEALVKFVRKYP